MLPQILPAIALLAQAVRAHPDNRSVRYRLALAYRKVAELKAAVVEMQKAIALDPEFKEAYVVLSEMEEKLNNTEAAQKALEMATSIDANVLSGLTTLATVHIRDVRSFLNTAPAIPAFYPARMMQGNLGEAYATLEKAKAIDAEDYWVQLRLCQVHEASGKVGSLVHSR